MSQKTIVITGASDGIGAAAARQLRAEGHRLLLVGRSADKTRAIASDLGADHFIADYSRLDDVRRLANELIASDGRLDVLANNAGAIFGAREVTVDGHERSFQVNYLAPFLLTKLLLPSLAAGEGIVVNTSSSAAKLFAHLDVADLESERNYHPNRAYGNAKLANILHARELNARFYRRGIHAVAFDPGNVRTNFAAETTSPLRFIHRSPLSHLLLSTPEKGGAHLAFFARGRPGADWDPGRFYTRTAPALDKNTNPLVHNDALAGYLWDLTEQRLNL